MERKKIYIIVILIVVLIAIAIGSYYFYQKNKGPTDQQKLDLLDKLSKDAEGSFTDQQKVEILDKVSAPSTTGSASGLTREQKLKIMQSGGQ